nr:vitamin D-binding protein [Pogona vitticeps]
MKTVAISIFLLVLTYSHALERGKDYFREKVCQEFNLMGKDKFHTVAIALNSKKYSNATYEEVTNIVTEIVALAEKCCVEGADPDCYTTESSALSVKSCDPNAVFPKHPGTAACCTEEGLARKLCLAALKHPPKEFFTYVEPQNDELCEAFKKDPRGFADRFLYEYSTDHSHTPMPLLLASATTYLSMVGTCCVHPQPTVCFLKERLERKPLQGLVHLSHKACSRYELFGKEKTTLSYLITFTQKSPNASFEDVLSLAEGASELLSKCCDSLEEDCLQRGVLAHTSNICNKLSAHDERIQNCCSEKNDLTKYLCIYFLPWAKQVADSQDTKGPEEALCGEDREREIYQNIHHLAQSFTHAPEAILTIYYDIIHDMVNACCSSPDVHACFTLKKQERTVEFHDLLSKGNALCADYTEHPFLEFKKRLRENYHKLFTTATEDEISALVERKATFASTCCLSNAPPRYCGLKVRDKIVHLCTHDVCVKN